MVLIIQRSLCIFCYVGVIVNVISGHMFLIISFCFLPKGSLFSLAYVQLILNVMFFL